MHADACEKPAGPHCASGLVVRTLAANAEFRNERLVTLLTFASHIIEKLSARRNHRQKAAARMIIFVVCFEVFGQVGDPFCQDRNLYFRRACIAIFYGEFLYQLCLSLWCNRHQVLSLLAPYSARLRFFWEDRITDLPQAKMSSSKGQPARPLPKAGIWHIYEELGSCFCGPNLYSFPMNLFLALSCLQGRPMQNAAEELLALNPDGLQLTAGNAPTVGFLDWAVETGVPLRSHHGFHDRAIRQRVWTEDLKITGSWHSVHPPHKGPGDWLPDEGFEGCLETMYPGEPLGTGKMIDAAMDRAIPLAVDVSHIFIQLTQGSMAEAQWHRLQDYPRIQEIHVSANRGDRDSHQPISPDSFGLDWARERSSVGTPRHA